MINKNDSYFMKLVLNLAKKGEYRTFPNPLVGAVVVKDGIVVGSGYHSVFGSDHAEVVAISDAGALANGGDMYVNLEPCSHFGKTPPCANLIVKSGIKRVVIANVDPNPLVCGRGIEILKKAGVIVKVGVLSADAKKLNKVFFNSVRKVGKVKSFIAVKMASSLDGKIASKTGDSKWITSNKSREFVHKMRSKFDAVLVGIATVLKDNPALTSHGFGKNPVRIVIDPELKIPLTAQILNDLKSAVVLFTDSNSVSKAKTSMLKKKGVYIVFIDGLFGENKFKYIIDKLNKMHIYKVLIEGGGETVGNAIEAKIVDVFYQFVAPKIIGGRDAKTSVEGSGVSLVKNAVHIKLSIKKNGLDYLLIGKLK